MIIWIILILVILTGVAFFAINNSALRWLVSGIMVLLTAAAVIALAMNMHSHFGMEKQTVTSTKQVYSILPAQSPIGAVAAKKIGSNDYVLVYKDHANDAKPEAHFAPDKKHIVETVKKSAGYKQTDVSNAQVVTKTTRWVYKNDMTKWLFQQKNEDNIISVRHTLEIPQNWLVKSL